ncbi:MAG TPA: thioesterase [Spirochaetia bacterium]|nr:thioesterase [Spirochaetia bacterium]
MIHKLFCIPHAGGFASRFIPLKRNLESTIQLMPVELKGHGKRLDEGFYGDFDEAVRDIVTILRREAAPFAYTVLGHSLGGLLAYDALCGMQELGLPLPRLLIISGINPPHIKTQGADYATLSDQELIAKTLALNGTQQDIFKNDQLRSLFLPILRADFRLLSQYPHDGQREPLACDIEIWNGTDDDLVDHDATPAWKNYTRATCRFRVFDGSHFFLFDNPQATVSVMNEVVLSGSG